MENNADEAAGGEGGGVTVKVPTLSLNNKSNGKPSKGRSSRSGSSGAVPIVEKRKKSKGATMEGGKEGGGEEDAALEKEKEKRGRSPRVKSGTSQGGLLASFPSASKGSSDKLAVPPLGQRRKRTVSTDVARMEGGGNDRKEEQEDGDARARASRVPHRSQDDSAIDTRSKEMASPRSERPLTSRGGQRDDTAADSSSDTESLDDLSRVSSDLEDMNIYLPPSFTDLSLAERVTVKVVHMLYNPRSGNKAGEKVMRKARKLFEDKYGKTVQVTKLQYKGHAEELCETMKLDGIDILCSVGGDGTFHECTNGMMKRMLADGAARVPPMALIAAGTGNSFMHELGYAKLKDAVHHICRGVHVPIDIAKLTFGDSTTCYAFNSMHWGMASKVAVTAEKLRWMGSAIRYTTAALIEMMKGSTARARITITDGDDNVITYDEDFALAIANNIITAGKGMKMAPTAKLDDGLIDLLLITTASTLDMMTIFRKVYDGTHTKLPHVRYIKVKSFSIVPYRTINEEKREKEKMSKNGSKTSLEQMSDSPSFKKRTDKDKDKDTIDRPSSGSSSSLMATTEDKGHETTASIGGSGGGGSGSGSQSNIEEIEELLDVDGELKGCTPFTCDIIPRALRVIL